MKKTATTRLMISLAGLCLLLQANPCQAQEAFNTDSADTVSRLLKENACPGCNLAGADLSGVNLNQADLRGANLAGANLEAASLKNAELEQADLKGANLKWAVLSGADLFHADLAGADLTDTSFEGAYLVGTILENSKQIGKQEDIDEFLTHHRQAPLPSDQVEEEAELAPGPVEVLPAEAEK